jgi:predicted MFS family arabinose efflux permease
MRVLVFACIVNLIGAAAEIAVVVTMRMHGTSSAVIGLVMAFAGAGAVAGSLLAMLILRRLSSASLFVVTGTTWALGCAVFATTSSPWGIAPMLVLMLLFAPVCGIRLGEITLGRAPAEILGRVNTAEQTINAGLASVGPLLAGVALQAVGQLGTWAAMAAICVTATLLVAVPMLSAERREQPDPLVEAGDPAGRGER